MEQRLHLTIFMAEQLAAQIVNDEERYLPSDGEKNQEILPEQWLDSNVYIVGNEGMVFSTNRLKGPRFGPFIPQSILTSEKEVQRIQINTEEESRLYVVKVPILLEDVQLGWVIVTQSEEELTEVNQEYGLLAVMLVSLALLGWAAIYLLSRKLSAPIKHVANGAKKVQAGDYHVELSEDSKVQEVHELVRSFKEMANRLEQLESLRTELLAGVTHELKTPVTSISGLLQALKDDVVSGEEAKEFLAISLKETERMQKMIGDLLAFNSFSANQFPVNKTKESINDLVAEFTHQWNITNDDGTVELDVRLLEKDCEVSTDGARLQQILVNLLNNARQSLEKHGVIRVTVRRVGDNIEIAVQDNGVGIPVKEQGLIFERFYRGENKKYKVRGLGLGLPFSKMIARALGGDLLLKSSSSEGTTFAILLPIDYHKLLSEKE